jgi:hypothetical protein
MKLHFDKKDSIYKIFKTINKIPSYRAVSIFIDGQNPFFRNQWRWKQIMEIIEQHHLQVTFTAPTREANEYLTAIGAIIKQQEHSPFHQFFTTLYQLLFTTKNLHNKLVLKQNYLSYLVIVAEITVIGGLLYALRWMISPNATIWVTPAHQVEDIVYSYRYYPSDQPLDASQEDRSFITIPYTIEHLPFDYSLTVNVQNITYTLTQAKGLVKVTNSLSTPFSLLGKTKFVNDQWVVFESDEWFTIPPAVGETPGIVYVPVTAAEYQEDGSMIGERGNIKGDTKLLIKNLPESAKQEAVIGIAVRDFVGGSTNATWTVISEDVEQIEANIIAYMEDKKKEYLQETFDASDKKILLFDKLIHLNINEFVTSANVGAVTAFIEGKVSATIDFTYIKDKDLEDAVDAYINQRPSENLQLLGFDTNSVSFYQLIPHPYMTGVYLIPTKMNVIRWYNFDRDGSGLLPEIKSKIAGTPREIAQQRIAEYPEIEKADIRISPPRYNTLPQIKSRIKFRTKGE